MAEVGVKRILAHLSVSSHDLGRIAAMADHRDIAAGILPWTRLSTAPAGVRAVSELAPFEVEEFWDDLLSFIEDGRVIPVVGAGLLRTKEGSATVPLYHAVACRLLRKYGVADPASLGSHDALHVHHELHDAVSVLAGRGKRIRDLYRPVHDILGDVLAGAQESLAPLRQLAAIPHFSLFATTTPDDLLAQALNLERFGGAKETDEIEYAPKLPTDRRRDMPEVPSSRYTAVFHLFGKADVQPFYAIHDEDALEFAYTLPLGGGPERIFSQLRGRNLLFIGCNFSDWLSRFFIRMSNSERLFSDQRSTKEFLVGDEGDEGHLTVFLERFSRDSRCYPTDPREFVAELYARWSARNPLFAARNGQTDSGTSEPATQMTSGAIFISYATEDIGAAKRLFVGLQEIGADVAWYDKSALRPGDDWEERIAGAIQRCSIFLPVISGNTEQRAEGYFRREWGAAAERTRRIQGRKFIFPIVVDRDYGGSMERYALVPEAFKAFQYSHAPSGEMDGALRSELTDQLRVIRRARAQ
ncbi:MAG: toll/interleukin-1 receptor domain-containing protein [Gemmatimonadaceae bacterium]